MKQTTSKDYRSLFVGLDVAAPLLNGTQRTYINLDNAASTPAMLPVLQTVQDFLAVYSSVHRGTGFKSQVATHAYEEARAAVMQFVGAHPDEHVCIFGKNTTEAVNKLARRFPFTKERDVVLTSLMEHHSNDLPWRAVAEVIHIRVREDGSLDEEDFDHQLEKYAARVALVAISGASNVTGFINPAHRLAEKAHAVGAQIMVDAAQLAPHRAIDMRRLQDAGHFDYLTLSGHKMYAPLGTGALIGRRDTFERGDPDLRGGGEVELVTLDQVVWSGAPERDEAGSPNTVGAVALAAAIYQLQAIGMDAVAQHEAELTAYTLEKLAEIPDIAVYGDRDPAHAAQRLGVLPVNLRGLSHFLVASILGHEFGIGVRNGCFCAHPYLLRLLRVDEDHASHVRSRIIANDRRDVPGMVRISFGLYNNFEEVDAVVAALKAIQQGQYQGQYRQDARSGEYHPVDWAFDVESAFSLRTHIVRE